LALVHILIQDGFTVHENESVVHLSHSQVCMIFTSIFRCT